MRIPFGHYEGQTLEEIADTDLDYLRWLLREEVGPEELRSEAARLLEARTYPVARRRPLRGQIPPWAWGLAGALLGAVAMLGVIRVLAPGLTSPQPTLLTSTMMTAAPSTLLPGPSAGTGRRPPTVLLNQPRSEAAETAVTEQRSGQGFTPAPPPSGTLAQPPALTQQVHLTPPSQVALTPTGTGDTCEVRQEGTLSPEEVPDHVGEYRSVQFRVVRTHNSGKAVFLNSHDPWQGHFEVVIFPDRWAEFPQPPEDLFLNRCIVVYGKLQLYKGAPEIVLQSADHIRTVE